MNPSPSPGTHARVCVVMPAYNAARFIAEAIQSVLQQTVCDLEVMVCDDGSADDTVAVVRSIQDDRVRLFIGPNHGPSSARNVGINAVCPTHEYVAFLDADDSWHPNKLERQLAYLEGHPECLAVGCLMQYVSAHNSVLGCAGQTVTTEECAKIAAGGLFPFPTSSIVVRRSAIDRVGGFDEGLDRIGAEDLDFVARVAQLGPVACVPEVLGSYRIHSSSTMARHQRRLSRGARFVCRRIAARAAGGDLKWEEFAATDRPTLRDQRQEMVAVYYRAAALSYAEGRRLKAICYGLIASTFGPAYTFRRLQRQALGPVGE
jgi:glycosyltransferase involved in cell wall biosynthesis